MLKLIVNDKYSMSNGIDTTSTIAHSVITGGAGVAIVAPDHTAQICSVLVQVIALVMLLIRGRKAKNEV